MSAAAICPLDELASLKSTFDPASAQRARHLLTSLLDRHFDAPRDLVRLHEIVMFERAYPHSPEVLRLAGQILSSFAGRMRDQDPDAFDDPEISGMAGTAVSSNFTFEIAQGLIARHRNSVGI